MSSPLSAIQTPAAPAAMAVASAAILLARVEDRDDVGWSIDARESRFAEEPLTAALVAQIIEHELERDGAPDDKARRAVDDADAAASDHGVEPVIPKLAPNAQRAQPL